MNPETGSLEALKQTKRNQKLIEFNVNESPASTSELMLLAIGNLGEYSAYKVKKDIYFELESSFYLKNMEEDLKFSSIFFDDFAKTQADSNYYNYYLLLSSASYYLSNNTGSSNVKSNEISSNDYQVYSNFEIDKMILWFLKSKYEFLNLKNTHVSRHLIALMRCYKNFLRNGEVSSSILTTYKELRNAVLFQAESRDVFLIDILGAVILKKIDNSNWSCLEKYSNNSMDKWKDVLEKKRFITEFWQSQQLIGEGGVFKGQSSVIQMPTGAGKTKSMEIVIRNVLLSYPNASVALIAPFKALCHEISNDLRYTFKGENVDVLELSDLNEDDFDLDSLPQDTLISRIIVATPEKMYFLLRNDSNLLSTLKLIIFDEGHQFDSGLRGVTFELLLSSISKEVEKDIQLILISAVMKNTEIIKKWLEFNTSLSYSEIHGDNLNSSRKDLAFCKIYKEKNEVGLSFVSYKEEAKYQYTFELPGIIKQISLPKKTREKKDRFLPVLDTFKDPSKDPSRVSSSISIYLALKLCQKDSLVIFCGTKNSVNKMSKDMIDVISRFKKSSGPKKYSNEEEVEKLAELISNNLGKDSHYYKAAEKGIFCHHANIPFGIKLAVQHAMKKNKIRVIICTSTLSQGVNLPIKYLIMSSVHQGDELIRAVDFDNLLGRVGRTGMYTEGTIIFSDPRIRSSKYVNKNYSNLIYGQEDVVNKTSTLHEFFLDQDIDHENYLEKYILKQKKLISGENFDFDFPEEDEYYNKILYQIESFLLASEDSESNDDFSKEIARTTLTYFASDELCKDKIEKTFKYLSDFIKEVVDPSERKSFSKSLLSVADNILLENYLIQNVQTIVDSQSIFDLIDALMPIIDNHISNKTYTKITVEKVNEHKKNLMKMWINGDSIKELLQYCSTNDIKKLRGKNTVRISLEDILDISEKGFSYESSLILSAIHSIFENKFPDQIFSLDEIAHLQKSLKYGVSDFTQIELFELGFSDRFVVKKLSSSFNLGFEDSVQNKITDQDNYELINYVRTLPAYFEQTFNRLNGIYTDID